VEAFFSNGEVDGFAIKGNSINGNPGEDLDRIEMELDCVKISDVPQGKQVIVGGVVMSGYQQGIELNGDEAARASPLCQRMNSTCDCVGQRAAVRYIVGGDGGPDYVSLTYIANCLSGVLPNPAVTCDDLDDWTQDPDQYPGDFDELFEWKHGEVVLTMGSPPFFGSSGNEGSTSGAADSGGAFRVMLIASLGVLVAALFH
jgi:hypothetical protein